MRSPAEHRLFYFLPGTGIFGGIKVGCQFASLLNRLGALCVLATPDGSAPTWFRCDVPVVSHATALETIAALGRDRATVLFSLPHDYPQLADSGAHLVFHCQGTDPLIDPILADPDVTLLSCWPQAARYFRERGRDDDIDVGIAISDTFFTGARRKQAGHVAWMPRRGAAIGRAARRRNRHLDFEAIEGSDEETVAGVLKRCEIFLATSENEWFGLPVFEAMAAGAVVLTVPVFGGMDYLKPGENCLVADPSDVPSTLTDLTNRHGEARRARLRHGALATALSLHPQRQARHLTALLNGPLAFLRP
ncbi:MAG: glycosyltransferase [Azospirillaceae bacterium]